MPNNLGLSGATNSKPAKFAPIFTSRFFSGLWTNRSPLRDATTSRLVEHYYGQAGDALIAGTNVEITNKLTLARRPGNSVFASQVYTDPDRFYSFRLFSATSPTLEDIDIIIDQANAIYSLYGGVLTDIFTKSSGAGQAYFQSVGDILYFGDGVETKKWLQTRNTWTANTLYGTDTLPFMTSFVFDSVGNIQQALGTYFPITEIAISAPTTTVDPIITLTSSVNPTLVLTVGDTLTFPRRIVGIPIFPGSSLPSPYDFLNGYSVTILTISSTQVTTTYPVNTIQPFTLPAGPTATPGAFTYAINNGTPLTGSVIPSFNPIRTLYTIDNQVVWVNRGLAVENWGIVNTPTLPFTPIVSPISEIGTGYPGVQVSLYSSLTPGTSFPTGFYVVDENGNIQVATTGGVSGTTTPIWSTILGQTTSDNSVVWTLEYLGALTALNGGWRYGVALVNTLDNTVSNCGQLSTPTGNFNGAQGIFLPPGAGIIPPTRTPFHSGALPPPTSALDPQADYVAIFRTTDGQAVPFLIPGQDGQTYTIRLSDYLQYGYTDTTLDVNLNNLISGAIIGENTPPLTTAINLTYHLNRIWYSIGNTVYWTSGPGTPVGNGLNGTNPLNSDTVASIVKRLVPTAAGLLVFTVSDVYIIQGNGTASNPIIPAVPLLPGIGLLSYNALDMNGPVIGLFTTDNQFIILDPSSGTTYAGLPLGDQFRLTNVDVPRQNWNPANVYVAWYVNGEDAGWYVCDGKFGWYRLMTTPAPETGYTWSPFATIVGGAGAVQNLEVTPGVHKLLIGPTGSGNILARTHDAFSDGGVPYPSNATIGSIVLTQPGQIAEVAFMTTEAVKTGTPLTLGLLIDEVLPYYTGPIDILTDWINDPPNLKPSRSLYSQRFYLDSEEGQDNTAAMRHCQVQIIFSEFDTVQNELLTFTVYGSYSQEL